ncbi:hypothetical protein KR054_005749 [Drosophila jambulina]|nr:hypothetical protein KR054_005749 [Drosophila jambulina]
MYNGEARTPQALKSRYFTNLSGLKAGRARRNSYTKGHTSAASATTTPTNGGKENGKCSPQMSAGVCTPPPKRLQKVRNPFEVAMADRLHLPLIASPSLFRSRTPQLCSTQFEHPWNIDEVSQLKPADVEPHETQFHDSPDPEVESKAQLAISAFFKESHNVPSPVDCPLRKHRIILEDNTPISNKSKRRRDCEVQTELTLPPVLPKALEEALRPYLQPHLAAGRSSAGRSKSSGGGHDIFNSSMRRKLFDLHNVIVLDDQQDPAEAGTSQQAMQTPFAGRLSDSASGEGIFGSLSPIGNLCGLPPGTPDNGNSSGKRRLLMQEMELPSPIAFSEHLSRRMAYSKVEMSSVTEQHDTLSERTALNFTPDRSSSPMGGGLEHSDGSINQRVSRLRVNSTRQQASDKPLFEEAEEEDDEDEEEEPEPDTEEDDEGEEAEAMQLTLSFNCSSSNSDTPRGHRRRRSAQRKNLSQSFSANLEEEEDQDHARDVSLMQQVEEPPLAVAPEQGPRIPLYRVDSGFNETTSTSAFVCSQDLPLDVSMACCSTPSSRS